MFSTATTSTTTTSFLTSASLRCTATTFANAMSHATKLDLPIPMVHSSTTSTTTLATRYIQTLTPPPHSRFLAFGSRYRESRGVPMNDERDGPTGNTTIPPPPKSRQFWDVVLSPSAPVPAQDQVPRSSITQHPFPTIRVHEEPTDHLPLPLAKPYDHLSLLNQCAAEAEANLAKARTDRSMVTISPDSDGTSSNGSSREGLLSPLSFLSHVSSFSSEATNLTTDSADPNRDKSRYTRGPLCESPVEYDYDEEVRGNDVQKVMKDLAGRVEDSRREVGMVLREGNEPESPFIAPVPLPLSPYISYQDDTRMELASPSPPSPIRPSFLSPCPSTFCLPSSSYSAPFIFQPKFDVDAVDGSLLWPTPYPSLLLPPSRYGQPNAANVTDKPPVIPSPRLLDRVLADLDLEADIPMDFRNSGLNAVQRCECVACVRWLGEQGIRAPRPVRPIAIGMMERLVQQWEEEAEEV